MAMIAEPVSSTPPAAPVASKGRGTGAPALPRVIDGQEHAGLKVTGARAALPAVPATFARRWREIRIRVLPWIGFACIASAVVALWRDQVISVPVPPVTGNPTNLAIPNETTTLGSP